MNVLDLIVLIIILTFAFIALKNGFIKTCFSAVPMLGAILISYKGSPYLNKFIRTTKFFDNYTKKISEYLNLENIISEGIYKTQTDLINSINAPKFIKESLMENNNSVVYGILDVTEIQDYISSYIANISINILCVVTLFVISYLIFMIIINALNFISELPVLNFFNKSTGFALGLAQGLLVVWILCIAATFFSYNPKYQTLFDMLDTSILADFLYNNNMLLFLILKIFA